MTTKDTKTRWIEPLHTTAHVASNGAHEIAGALNVTVADMFALYLKTKNFHWHVSGPHFRDYHLMLDDQATQILATTDVIAERVRKLGAATLRSIGHVAQLQRVADNDATHIAPLDMLAELREDNVQLATRLRETYVLCDRLGDVASASLLETWVDEAEGRAWSLYETGRQI